MVHQGNTRWYTPEGAPRAWLPTQVRQTIGADGLVIACFLLGPPTCVLQVSGFEIQVHFPT